ncbi:MAG: peptidylprolyl isomerase [Nitrospinota bacterium]
MCFETDSREIAMPSATRIIPLSYFLFALGVFALAGCPSSEEGKASSDVTGGEPWGGPLDPTERVPEDAKWEPRFEGVLKPDHVYRAAIDMEKGGSIILRFYPRQAPNHVANFVHLARKGFYDGVMFHRVIPGFMAQGGDPRGTGMGGPGYTIQAEFNELLHRRGTLSMARTPDPNSAGSQFFICFQPQPRLDHKYTVFGQVLEGMDVVDGIAPRDPAAGGPPGDKMKTVRVQVIPPG